MELQNYLPVWLLPVALPSIALIGFFWKGDDALSPEFKQWLSEKLSGVGLTTKRESIEPLGRVFDFVYGKQLFSFNSFIRVAIVSAIAAAIAFVVINEGFGILGIRDFGELFLSRPERILAFLGVNSVFDYISVTKARIVMRAIVKIDLRYKNFLFLFFDAFLTAIIVWLYMRVIGIFFDVLFRNSWAFFGYLFIPPAFYATTFLIFFLTSMYLLSLGSFVIIRSLPILSAILWILPVRTLPIRSIGLMSGVILFIALSIITLARSLLA